jgi:CHASE2 domain-containing sensor protein
VADAPKPSALSAATGRWRDRLLDAAVITIPTALVTQSVNWVQGRFFAEPWQILWIAAPLAVGAFIAWKLLRQPTARRIDWRFGLFLVVYATLFSIASASDLLVWKRVPVADFAADTGRNWLLPVTLGDWRYRLLPDAAMPSGLTVLLLDHHGDQPPEIKRIFDAQIIQAGAAQGASGIFFDVAYPQPTVTDPVLCASVDLAAAANIPVATVYGLKAIGGSDIYAPDPASTQATPDCLKEKKGRSVYRAHSMVFADVDGIVRSLPLDWAAAPGHVPLSQRIAQAMNTAKDGLKLPDTKLLRFAHVAATPRIVAGDAAVREFIGTPDAAKNRWLVVGELSTSDEFRTPWDEHTPGVLLHAYAASTLLANAAIVRPPAWLSAFVVVAACAILALFASQGAATRRLLLVAALTTAGVFALAAMAIALFRVWLDVIYAVTALWLLLPLLLAYRKLSA